MARINLPAIRGRSDSYHETAMTRRPEEGLMPLRDVMNRLFQESFLMPSVFDRFFEEFSQDFGSTWRQVGTNLYETGDNYVVQIALPGMKPDSISCTVEGNVLTCTAESLVQAPEKANALWQSFGGKAEYQVTLPGEVQSDQAQATYEHGVLTITLPKTAQARAKHIKVTAK